MRRSASLGLLIAPVLSPSYFPAPSSHGVGPGLLPRGFLEEGLAAEATRLLVLYNQYGEKGISHGKII